MGQIRVSPETLQTRAREYNKASNEVNSILSNLTGLQFNELKPKVREFAELLEQINLQLVSAARAMEEHDQALSQKFGLN